VGLDARVERRQSRVEFAHHRAVLSDETVVAIDGHLAVSVYPRSSQVDLSAQPSNLSLARVEGRFLDVDHLGSSVDLALEPQATLELILVQHVGAIGPAPGQATGTEAHSAAAPR